MKSRDRRADEALGPKAVKLVEAIVDAAIARGDGSAGDRAQLVRDAMEQFRRVSNLQAEAAKLIRKQRRRLADQAGRMIALEEQLREVRKLLARRERRLANARETILNYDGEIERLTAQVRADADLIEELRAAPRPRQGSRGRNKRPGSAGRSDPAGGATQPHASG